MNIEEDQAEEDEGIEEDEGAQNLQIKEMLKDSNSLSSDHLYLVDFSDLQFLQEGTMISRYTIESKVMSNNVLKRKRASTQDTKSLFLDTGSTFSCCNNLKMLINIKKCKKSINRVSNGGVIVTDKEGDLLGFPSSLL